MAEVAAQASADGEGQDDFVFTLSKDEFLDLFFEDLKLPNLIKTKHQGSQDAGAAACRLHDRRPAGQAQSRAHDAPQPRAPHRAAPAQGRGRPHLEEEMLAEAEGETPRDDVRIAELKARARAVARGCAARSPTSIRSTCSTTVSSACRSPATQAVMFCLMDASASMTEPLKDLAKRFFMLLHLFLSRHYREVDVVFIRHTSTASEVDEETFFRGVETGGTVISTALEEMDRIVARPLFAGGLEHLRGAGLRRRQHSRRHGPLPRTRRAAACCPPASTSPTSRCSERASAPARRSCGTATRKSADRNRHFAMRRVSSPAEIFPVFHELFSSTAAGG